MMPQISAPFGGGAFANMSESEFIFAALSAFGIERALEEGLEGMLAAWACMVARARFLVSIGVIHRVIYCLSDRFAGMATVASTVRRTSKKTFILSGLREGLS